MMMVMVMMILSMCSTRRMHMKQASKQSLTDDRHMWMRHPEAVEAHQPARVALEHQLAAPRSNGLQVNHVLEGLREGMLRDEAMGSLVVRLFGTCMCICKRACREVT